MLCTLDTIFSFFKNKIKPQSAQCSTLRSMCDGNDTGPHDTNYHSSSSVCRLRRRCRRRRSSLRLLSMHLAFSTAQRAERRSDDIIIDLLPRPRARWLLPTYNGLESNVDAFTRYAFFLVCVVLHLCAASAPAPLFALVPPPPPPPSLRNLR